MKKILEIKNNGKINTEIYKQHFKNKKRTIRNQLEINWNLNGKMNHKTKTTNF